MIPPEPQNFGFKFPALGSVPVLFSSMVADVGLFDILYFYCSSIKLDLNLFIYLKKVPLGFTASS